MKKALLQLSAIALAFVSFVNVSRADAFITSSTCIPPVGGVYATPGCVSYYTGYFISFCQSSISSFSTCDAPPLAMAGATKTISGMCTFDSYTSVWGHITVPAQFKFRLTYYDSDSISDSYETEVLQLDLTGGGGAYMLRESPVFFSSGITKITRGSAGTYKIASDFNLMTEASFNGGADWIRQEESLNHYALKPNTPPCGVGLTAYSNTPVCIGAPIDLTSTASGNTAPDSYSWTGPNGFSSNLQNPTIASALSTSAGTYTVTITDFYNCTATRSIVVSTITCNGTGCQFNEAVQACVGACPMLYNGNGTEVGSGDCITKVVKSKGKTTTTCSCGPVYVSSSNCSSSRGRCSGKCDVLYASKADAAAKLNPINGTCGDNNGCSCKYLYPAPPRIGGDAQEQATSFLEKQLTIFPNPAVQQISIDVNHFQGRVQLMMVNMLGQSIVTKAVELKGEETWSTDITSLAPGIYKVILSNDSQMSSGTFVKN